MPPAFLIPSGSGSRAAAHPSVLGLRARAAACLLGLAALAFAAPASAEVLVSNIGQSTSTTRAFSDVDSAQAFTTGSNAKGYTLTNVEVKFPVAPGSDLRVRLLQDTPTGTNVATLTNPTSLVAGDLTFTAPGRYHAVGQHDVFRGSGHDDDGVG